MKVLHMTAFILMAVGAINWGLVGLFNFNVVTAILGGFPMITSLVYVLVGISGVYILITHKKDCKICAGK